jgi:methyltransferase (TIGR00027 family)
MTGQNVSVRNISDTALWVASFRARETQRPDALFRDPFAERLAGERGFQIANTLADGNKHQWAWATRTYLFDQFINREVREGADVVVNLAAGLDARPYRMNIPASLRWIEIDLPAMLAYKEEILANDRPRCDMRRISLDLRDVQARRKVFRDVDRQSRTTVVAAEGLLLYFDAEEVASLARDLAVCAHYTSWIIDLASPGQLKLMQRTMGRQLSEAGAEFKFGPSEGPAFFLEHGWEPKDVQGVLKTAAEFGRPPRELLSLLPEPAGPPGNYPWSGVCLLRKRLPVRP